MQTSGKLISITGTTATGKTSLALFLAEKFLSLNQDEKQNGVCLISADSRQVYQGLEILTGADVPSNFQKLKKPSTSISPISDYQVYLNNKQNIFLTGVSVIKPHQDWSTAHFRNLAIQAIKYCWSNNWLPVVVGGTGLYHQQVFNNDPQLYVKPSQKLRNKAEKFELKKLQQWLQKLDPDRYQSMNQSDKNNPRRLIRAIEITTALKNPSKRILERPQIKKPQLHYKIGLKLSENLLKEKISNRIEKRISQGAVQEVKQLLQLNLKPAAPARQIIGVSQLAGYIQNQITLKEVKLSWAQEEIQYARRQITWFQKYLPDSWFNPSRTNFKNRIWNKAKKQLKFKTD